MDAERRSRPPAQVMRLFAAVSGSFNCFCCTLYHSSTAPPTHPDPQQAPVHTCKSGFNRSIFSTGPTDPADPAGPAGLASSKPTCASTAVAITAEDDMNVDSVGGVATDSAHKPSFPHHPAGSASAQELDARPPPAASRVSAAGEGPIDDGDGLWGQRLNAWGAGSIRCGSGSGSGSGSAGDVRLASDDQASLHQQVKYRWRYSNHNLVHTLLIQMHASVTKRCLESDEMPSLYISTWWWSYPLKTSMASVSPLIHTHPASPTLSGPGPVG